TAQMGEVCTLINTSCCTYIDQTGKIEEDIQKIWDQAKILVQDDANRGKGLWDALTSWLPNLNWIKHLFVALVSVMTMLVLICILFQCFVWCCIKSSSSYEEWKKSNVRHQVETGKYFQKI
ncbi:ERVV2 protein, partial [Calyptomena viridis]|nr:ERVV2 protein [Calyptomena viridis]